MKTKIFSVAVALAFVFSACNKDLPDASEVSEGGVKAKAVSGLVWNGASDVAVAANIDAVANDTRKNASGAKITSNAHSADFPGIYFIWDSKQKDNGYLKVDAAVFDKYVGFTLTSKESNTYWDFNISIQPGQEKTGDNCYVFYIPKVYNNKNINMVFISAFVEKTIIIVKDPPIEEVDGCKTTISIISGAKSDDIIVDPYNTFTINGTPIKTYWNNNLGSTYKTELTGITAQEKTANWIWHRIDSWAEGFSGSNFINTVSEFNIDGEIAEDKVMFYFACDNAAVLFVNGKRVAYTPSLEGKWIPETPDQVFPDFTSNGFEDTQEYWSQIVAVDIKSYLHQGSSNKIVIVAANNDENGDMYNTENNPAGLIYACQFTVEKDCNKCLSYYYAICQLYNDLRWGADGFGLDKSVTDQVTPDEKASMQVIGEAHRDALQDWWEKPREDENVRYIPVGEDDAFHCEWQDIIRYGEGTGADGQELNSPSVQAICDRLKIDIDIFVINYDWQEFVTRNKLWPE